MAFPSEKTAADAKPPPQATGYPLAYVAAKLIIRPGSRVHQKQRDGHDHGLLRTVLRLLCGQDAALGHARSAEESELFLRNLFNETSTLIWRPERDASPRRARRNVRDLARVDARNSDKRSDHPTV